MKNLLKNIEEQWKTSSIKYDDVQAIQVEKIDHKIEENCPEGRTLTLHGAESGGHKVDWCSMGDYGDFYSQTRTWRKHGYARIYVITGLELHTQSKKS